MGRAPPLPAPLAGRLPEPHPLPRATRRRPSLVGPTDPPSGEAAQTALPGPLAAGGRRGVACVPRRGGCPCCGPDRRHRQLAGGVRPARSGPATVVGGGPADVRGRSVRHLPRVWCAPVGLVIMEPGLIATHMAPWLPSRTWHIEPLRRCGARSCRGSSYGRPPNGWCASQQLPSEPQMRCSASSGGCLL